MKAVQLRNVHHGKGQRSGIIYADIHSRDGLEVSATLEYCLDAIEKRGWVLVSELPESGMSIAKVWLSKEKEHVPRLASVIDDVLSSEKSVEALDNIIAGIKDLLPSEKKHTIHGCTFHMHGSDYDGVVEGQVLFTPLGSTKTNTSGGVYMVKRDGSLDLHDLHIMSNHEYEELVKWKEIAKKMLDDGTAG